MDNFRQNRGVIHNSEKVININHINSVFPSKNAYVKICIKFRIFRLAYGRYFQSVLIDRNGGRFDDFLSMAALSFPGETGDREFENKARKYRLFRMGCIFSAIGFNTF